MTDTGSAIADLQSHWHALCDLDRARAVQSIHQDGMSLRALAPQLNCSPSLLSHLLWAAQAPTEDRELARCGEMSTRELARRAGTMPLPLGKTYCTPGALGAFMGALDEVPSDGRYWHDDSVASAMMIASQSR
jgi:hypothetical protein